MPECPEDTDFCFFLHHKYQVHLILLHVPIRINRIDIFRQLQKFSFNRKVAHTLCSLSQLRKMRTSDLQMNECQPFHCNKRKICYIVSMSADLLGPPRLTTMTFKFSFFSIVCQCEIWLLYSVSKT